MQKTSTRVDMFVDLREDAGSPACHGCEDSRAEVSGWVDGVARVEAHRQANDQNHEANSEGLQSLRDGVVVRIHDGQDANDERGCADDLRKAEDEIEERPPGVESLRRSDTCLSEKKIPDRRSR